MNATRLVFLLLLLAGPERAAAVAASSSTYTIAVDPRFELLGVLYELTGRGRSDRSTDAYRAEVRKRFSAFRSHPAVLSFERVVSSGNGESLFATAVLFHSDPPELALLDEGADIPGFRTPAGREELSAFLGELRDFVRASGFQEFYREHAVFYRDMEKATAKTFAGHDPVAELESYLGIALDSRVHYLVPLLFQDRHNFITPYPLPPFALGAKRFEVYTMLALPGAKDFSVGVWDEVLYVFIDPAFFYFDKAAASSPEAFYGPEIARCRAVAPDCAKDFLGEALIYHLRGKNRAKVPEVRGNEESVRLRKRYTAALSERLDEYERRRAEFPTLWDFFPRLLAIFPEQAFPGKPAPEVKLPPVKRSTDFFAPAGAQGNAIVRP